MRFRMCCLLIVYTIVASANECFAGAALRVICEGEDVGAEVYINGKFKGECPIDMEVASGTLKLKVVKGENEFVQDIRIGDGVVKKIEPVLKLNAAAQKRENERQAAKAKRLAQEAEAEASRKLKEKQARMEQYEKELAQYNYDVAHYEERVNARKNFCQGEFNQRWQHCRDIMPFWKAQDQSEWIACKDNAQLEWRKCNNIPVPVRPVKPD